MMIRYASVCSGIEAATMAWHPLGWEPAFFSEIEPFPSAVLAHHYGSNLPGEPPARNGVPNHGDFTKIGDEAIDAAGPVDLLVGGTPCQSFSIAGKRLGLDDPRGHLALEYLRLARRLRARWLVWENVPGVFSSNGGGGDFATFLSFVRECGYGFAYRVLDAQYVRVDGFGRAVPQRRRRVFVVGYLGDWRRAAAVLLEPQGMRGDSPPRRWSGQGVAGTISARPSAGGGLGTDFGLNGGLIANSLRAQMQDPHDESKGTYIPVAFGGGNTSGLLDVSTALTAHGRRQDFEVETFVAHALRGEGFDASEDGTGRGTPIVPVAGALCRDSFSGGAGGRPEGAAAGHFVPVAFDCKASGRNGFGVGEISPTLRSMGHADSHQNAGGQVAVVHPYTLASRGRGGGHDLEFRQDGTANAILTANGGRAGMGVGAIATEWAVRRLKPRECERLQGFPDDFTDVPWRGKPGAPDGPRYRALGNSMAVNVMRWIGWRIDHFEKLVAAGRISK